MAIEESKTDHKELMDQLRESLPGVDDAVLRVKASRLQMKNIRELVEKII
jgi:hypothetical protein